MSKIKTDQFWSQLGIMGTGMVVGIVDTGVNSNHVAISGKNRVKNTYSFVQYISGYGTCTVTNPYDDHGHGTHVIGTILGSDGGSNQNGVAPGAKWIAAKALDYTGSGWSDDLLAAMQWIQAPGDKASMAPDMVNSSWDSTYNCSNY